MAREFLLRRFGNRFVELHVIIVQEFLARLDVAQRLNEDTVVFLDRFAVWIARMINPARIVAANFWIDHLAVFQTEIESVWIVFVVGSGFPGDAFTCVFDDTPAPANELTRVNTPAVHVGFTNLKLHGPSPSFGFLRHAQSWNYFWFFTRACGGINPIPQRRLLQKEQTFGIGLQDTSEVADSCQMLQ